MNIEKIDASRIIISLGDNDMEKFSVTFESLSLSEIHSRNVLKNILYYASAKTGINFKDKKILIEAMKYEHGCILLLTLREKNKKRKIYKVKNRNNSYIFAFNSVESFLACIKAIYHINDCRFLSSAFLYKNIYYLTIQPTAVLKTKYIKTINEFSYKNKIGNLCISALKEHAKIISLKNAVENIGQHL